MKAYSCEPGISPEDIDAALQALSLGEAEVPVLGALPEERKIAFASQTMLALFRVADLAGLAARLFAGDDSGANRLLALAEAEDGAPRLERLSFSFDGVQETLTFLCRRISTPEKKLFLAAALGAKTEPSALHSLRLDEVRKVLSTRLGMRTNIRFLWRTDADDKITEITPPLAEVIGAAAADFLGCDFADVAKYLERESDARLGRAFRERETFSGIEVLWPIADAAAAVPVSLGGLPAFDRDRRFDGYRGFGVIHLERLTAAEPRLFLVAAPELPAPSEPELPFATNIVQLRPPAKSAEPIAPSDAAEVDEAHLSHDERTAFREIDEVLKEETIASTGPAET
ncbi:MAG: hypothetical protein WBC64_04010, partial [Methylovirgula sp.]